MKLRTTLVFAALVLPACAPRVDTKQLEKDIMATPGMPALTLKSVSCPTGITAKSGTKFQCTCVDDNGTAGVFDVWIVDMQAHWKLQGKFENMEQVGDFLEKDLEAKSNGKPVDVKCPSKNILIAKGVSFTCDYTVGDEKHEVTVTASDDEGHWKPVDKQVEE